MTHDPDDPVRLLNAADVPPGLRDVFKSAQSDVGSDAQLARLAQRLGPILGGAALASGASGTAGATAATAKGAAASVAALKLGGAALALIIAGGGAWLYSTSSSTPGSDRLATGSATPPPAPTRIAEHKPVAPPPAPSDVAIPSEAVAPSPPSVSSQPSTKPVPAPQLSEADLLEQARAASKSDPARALARANEHARRFPRGVLVQEREVIAIQALRKLGRAGEANRRAEAFAKAFPGSAFARKLQASP